MRLKVEVRNEDKKTNSVARCWHKKWPNFANNLPKNVKSHIRFYLISDIFQYSNDMVIFWLHLQENYIDKTF